MGIFHLRCSSTLCAYLICLVLQTAKLRERGNVTVMCHTHSLQQNEFKRYMPALTSNFLSVLIITTRLLNKKTCGEKKSKRHLKHVLARLKNKSILNCALLKGSDLLSNLYIKYVRYSSMCMYINLQDTPYKLIRHVSVLFNSNSTEYVVKYIP